ncbi:MAG: tRNA (adenosine(37)-N6)-threonylcarbamoyltransferase complex dimerization subunit type 1 TsaB [Chloroflexota bacterium]|nr:tRNA (adenosine(37)-N6)-threonylcarbamoyltransferase complex dimerization subunit type 1 TsaB [Chloroflexota bacterium]MDE2884071.1 tRNA (adenosine(37)-N6)-threonylcarbamoyltransferase complex dimerization subunit type 1 TsaB [Chloroflexota bacterium]
MTAYLVIDTSTRYGAAALWRDGLSRLVSWRSRNNHTAELMPAIRWLTEAEGISPDALDGVAVSVGPGGFSALRTGIGVAKGLAVAWSLPVAGVSTLEASAYPYRSAARRVCAVLPAGRGAVAWAVYGTDEGGWSALSEEQVSSISEFAAAQSGDTLFCGESAADVADALREHMGASARSVTESAPLARLSGVGEIGAEALASGEAIGASAIAPRYLRPPRITPPGPPKPVAGG